MRNPYINIKSWLGRISQILANELKKPKKFIYLTFDDGPLPGTCQTIDLCKNLNSKATYFMVGCHNKSEQTNQTIQSLIYSKNQFIVGNHSFSHANEKYKEYYQDPMAVLADFEKARLSLGLETKIARLPGLSAWANSTFFFGPKVIRSVCNVLITSGYSILGWDVEWKPIKESLKFSSKYIIFRWTIILKLFALRTHSRNHIVVLFHDISFRDEANLAALRKLILSFQKSKKYSFETIDKHPFCKNPN